MKRTQGFIRAQAIAGAALASVLAVGLAGCGSSGSSTGADALTAKGDIKIWLSNNKAEVAWGKQLVDSWNKDHPDEQVSAQEIPAGKSSEEVITSAITAGNAPCLVLNTAPAAVPQFQKAGGLVDLTAFPDGEKYITDRTGDQAEQFRSADGKFYQMPWKSNPVVIYYNKDMFAKAGLDPENPPLETQDEFLAAGEKLVASGASQYAIFPSPGSEFYQSFFDFLPIFATNSSGKMIVEDGKATFADKAGIATAEFWKKIYDKKLAGTEVYVGDAFADGKSAMAISGPWAIAAYGDKVNWGTVPVPVQKTGDKSYTFSDAKNIGMYTSCKNQGTAWDFLKYATSEEQDGTFLTETGQMPIRSNLDTVYSDYFAANPEYLSFAEQAGRAVDIPSVPGAVEILQVLRDAYLKSVINGSESIDKAFSDAATKVDTLAKG